MAGAGGEVLGDAWGDPGGEPGGATGACRTTSAIAALGVTGVTASIRVTVVVAGSAAATSQVAQRITPLNTHMRQMNVPHVAQG